MKANLVTAVLFLTGADSQLHSAPWAIAWSHLIASDNCEVNAVLLKSSSREVIVMGTTFGSQIKPASDPYVFRSVLDGKGNPVSAEQFGIAGGQRLYGAVRSCWGNETLVLKDYKEGTWKLLGRNAFGKPCWRLPMASEQLPMTGLVRDGWGNHWIASQPSGQRKPYVVSKIGRCGKLLWTREASNPDRLRMPRVLRRSPEGDLIIGAGGDKLSVARYDGEMKLKWCTVLDAPKDALRDLALDSTGRMFVTTVSYSSLSDWHTKVWSLAPDGTVLGVRRVDARVFSGWRVATDSRGHVYVAGSEYGEPGYPLVVEFDPTLKEVGRFYVDRNSPVFFDSLRVTPDGRELTMTGTAQGRWMGMPTHGTADAFVVRCHRDDTNPAPPNSRQKPSPKKPTRATPPQYPW